jgi:D-glycero-alpha-D-manno-heptose-7-phosphate kinase
LTGAGGGGFMLLFVAPDMQENVRLRLRKLLRVPFKLESSGSQIVFYDPEENFEGFEDNPMIEQPAGAGVSL